MKIIITGGAGFIGSNLANRLLSDGHDLIIFDNLSRSGCNKNLSWLEEIHGRGSFRLIHADLNDFKSLLSAMNGVEQVYHLAGQVAVTNSVQYPRKDFEDNALGTFNVLESARLAGNDPVFVYASTNKVYGKMEDIKIKETGTRYIYTDHPNGISESQPLDFHSPYGCSKGSGDQYTRDYYRIYGLRTVVLRQSCIYGYRQFGIEDQGWVAWFIIAAIKNRPITIYGNGKQVRDILFIDDLLDAYKRAVDNIDKASGEVFNIGGGPNNTISIWAEFGYMLEDLMSISVPVNYGAWRPGDQPVYISDIRKAQTVLGWVPQITVTQGIEQLFWWLKDNSRLFNYL